MKKPSEHISNSIDVFRNKKKFKSQLLAIEAENHLKHIFGTLSDQHITKTRVTGSTLHIYVNSSTLKHELHHEKEKLKNRLNDLFKSDAITDIQIHG